VRKADGGRSRGYNWYLKGEVPYGLIRLVISHALVV